MFTLHSWLVNKLTKQLIIKTICNSKYLLTAEMMLSILVLYGWGLQLHNLPELYLIQVQNIWQLHQSFVMTKQLEIINSKSMILFRVVSFKETKCTEDVKQWHTTCTSLIQTKYYQRLAPNWHTVPQNYKDLFGKTILAFNHWKQEINLCLVFNWNWNWNLTNVLSSNFWVYINPKVLVTIQMVFSDFHLIRIWRRRSSIICGR